MASPSVEKRYAYSPTAERGRRTTTPHHQKRREKDREQISENKENVAEEKKDEPFALPPPRTPASSKKNARPNRNVLTTPNKNTNGATKSNVGTPKGEENLFLIVLFRGDRTSLNLFVFYNCLFFQTRA